MMESSSRVDEKPTKPKDKKSTLAIPSRRVGSKSPVRKDQNENESRQKSIAANIQSRNPTRVVHSRHTKDLRSKRVNSDSCKEEEKGPPKTGKEHPEDEIAEINSPPTQRDKQKESSTDTEKQRRLSEPKSPADSTSPEVSSELIKVTRKTKNKSEGKSVTPRTKVSERLRHKSSDNFDKDNITKKCSVRLCHLDIDVKTILNMEDLKKSPSISKESKDPQKRDNESYHIDGPVTKKHKNDDIIILEPDNKPMERISKPPTPDVTVIKVKSSSKEVASSNSTKEKKSSSNRSPSGESRNKHSTEKPTLQRAGSFESMRKSDSNNQKSSKSSSSSSSTSTLDKTDRTSLQCLEQKLLDLQKATQKTKHTSDFHSSKPKSMSPSGLKPSKDLYHRRKEDFITERKKVNSSPIKKPLKKSVSLPPVKDNKMGNLFCPTTDAKVTILPINKPNAKDVDHKPPSTSNSVTITKLSSGDSLSVPAKDIKKVFTSKSDMKSEMKSKVSPVTIKNQTKFSVKNFSKTEKHRSSDKSEKVHREHKNRDKEFHSRESSREGRERSRERRDHKENSKHIGCSKCHEQFSTKEAKKLHTCNSILDAHYLIDGRDRQKTSPTSSASNSERSESTSASLSRSSSRSSSPGIPIVNNKKPCSETPKLKISMKSDKLEDKIGKVKISLKKEDSEEKLKDKDKKLDRYVPKRDSMKEKWVESKPSFKSEHHSDEPLTKDSTHVQDSDKPRDRTTSITIEALKVDHDEKSDNQVKHSTSSLEIVKLDGDVCKKETKEELPLVHDRMDHAFAFSGKRTYSPSMSETASVDGKESPRETNSKDSPASQADSGVFSIASSASPSKVDGVLNTDVRSPESPSRERINCLDSSAPLKPDVNQWKTSIALSTGIHGGHMVQESRLLTTTSSSASASSFGFKGESSDSGLPQGIQIPNNLSITRVMSQVSTSYTSNSATSPVMASSNKTMNIIANAPWMSNNVPMSSNVSHISPHFFTSNLLDDSSKKKRGRPRKNNYEAFSSKSKGPKSKSDEDKDMYDFETEEDESKPVQPLRPRRQNAQPITYKDPDSDEDAKQRASQTTPLIQTTQGFRQVHDKALGLNQVDGFGHNPILQENSNEEGDNQDDTDKDEKNVSYTCSEIEETPKGGIKLKIKIKKSASPAPADPEPPVKKPKTESYDEMQGFPKEEPSIMSTMGEMQRLASGMGRSSSIEDSRILKSPVKSPHPTINMNANSPHTMSRMLMKPGIPGGGEPKNQTPPHLSQNLHGPMRPNGSNNNPAPISNSPAAADDTSRAPYPKVHNPYAMQNNFPNQSQGPHPNNPNNFEMQQNFPQGNFGDYTNYNLSYNNYMEQQQQQMSMFNRQQYEQHMSAFRPGMPQRISAPSMPIKPGFIPPRMMDPRFSHHNQPPHMSEMEAMSRMSNMPRMPGMNNMDAARMNPNMNTALNPGMNPHPSMMGSMMPGMGPSQMSGPGYPNNSMAGMGNMATNSIPSSIGHGPSIPSSPIMNSSVMNNTMSGGVMPPTMSPGSMQSIMHPSRSPQSIPMNDRPLFQPNQYRMSSPQYQNQGHPNYNNSPTYPGTPNSQGYPRPPTPGGYPKPPTPGGYPKPPTPQNYGKPPTPQNSSIQNPLTPGSYQNPTTPGSYQNPTTPVSNQNPLTPVSHQNPLTPQPQDPPLQQITNPTLQNQQSTPMGPDSKSSLTQPVIQQNPLNSNNSFNLPKSDPVIQSATVPNIFKDGSKITTPMLSPPSTVSTSSLRKIRRPSKSVTPGTVSPNQKNLSPNQSKECIKSEPDPLIEPKKEPDCDSPPDIPTENERIQEPTSIKSEPSPKPILPKEEKPDTPPPESPTPPPPAKTPDPPKEPRWGEDGPDGVPERALKSIFSYVCHDSGCLPFLPNAMRVCKLWNKVAKDPTLWTHANLGSNIKEKLRTEKKLEWILKNKFPNAIDVDVQNWRAAISSPALKIIAANCPKLTGLGLSSCIKLNYEDVRIIPSLFPNLERIDLSSVSPSTASSRSAASSTCLSDMITAIGEKLTHFSMSNNKMAGLPFVFKAISQHSKNLRLLDVSSISTTSRDTILINIEKLQKGCPKLTKFRTTNTMLGLNDVPVREQMAAPGFPYLEELTIGVDQRGYFDGMDDQQIERILKKSDKLKVLDIRGCKGINDSTLVRLPCWEIEYLYVAGCSVTSSSRDGLELLVKKWCRTLVDLDIGNTTDARTVDWAVMALVENEEYIRLRTLNLNGTGVSLKSLTKLLGCCPTLQSLNLTSCRALPRGMKRMYHTKEDVEGLRQDIQDGKFDPKDAGSDDDD